jgi:AraC-like DNA-binding protein
LQRAASEVTDRNAGVPFFPAPVVNDPHIARLLLNLHVAIESNESELERESRLIWTMAQLVARHADERLSERPMRVERTVVSQVCSHLEQHLHENVTLDRLARMVNMSAFHLLRTFRNATGLPPHTYLNQLRVARAKLLLSDGMPIAIVASEVGFTDQSHLTRHFKRIVGVTPGQFARGAPSLRGRGEGVREQFHPRHGASQQVCCHDDVSR